MFRITIDLKEKKEKMDWMNSPKKSFKVNSACHSFFYLFGLMLGLHSSTVLVAKNETGGNLDRLELLEQRVTVLEKENGILKERLAKLEGAPAPIQPRELADILPKEEKEKKFFLESFRRELKSDAARASGPWTSPDSWALIRKRMSSFEVRETLGRPTRMKPSVRPAIDEVYYYKGDLDADGIEEEGVVNFKDKRVVSFESPHSN